MTEELSVVGKRLPRLGAGDMSTGATRYTVDIKLPGLLTARVLRSPHAHANVLRIDTSRAEKLPGVEAVITHKDVPGKKFNRDNLSLLLDIPEKSIKDETIFSNKVRFIGDEVAAVAAINESTAEKALELIDVEYEVLPAVFDPIEAMKPDAPRIHDFAENNIADHIPGGESRGDVEVGFKEADVVIEQSFSTTKQKHCHMEPHVCLASFDSSGRLTLWACSQQPHLLRGKIAELFDIPVGMIKVITPYLGGAFGGKLSFNGEQICVALAKKAGRPVRLEYTREEDFIAGETRQPFIQSGKIGVKKDGTITALQMKVITHAGAYFTQSGGPTGVTMADFSGPYRCPNLLAEADIVYTNTAISGGFRGYGNPQAMWVLEQLVDMAAEKIGMDAAEFRIMNHKQAGEYCKVGYPVETCALDDCIKSGSARIGWKEKRGRKKDGVTARGVGMAIMCHVTGAHNSLLEESSAFIKFNEDGSANLLIGVIDMGQNSLGTLAQIAAEELGLPAEDIHVVHGDTDVTMFDVGQHASRTVYCVGNAVVRAAAEAKQQLLERAARILKTQANKLEVKNRRVYIKTNPQKGVAIADITRNATYNFNGDCLNISGKCTWEPKDNPFPYQAVFAEVEVDTETGVVKLVKIVVAHDIGRAINPATVEGQLEGGVSQGIGYGLIEYFAVNKDTGEVDSTNFETYKIASTLDMPDTEVILVEQPVPSGPFGAKSVGESSMVATAPAIANAVYDAVGVRIKDLPITPEKVLQGLKAKSGTLFIH